MLEREYFRKLDERDKADISTIALEEQLTWSFRYNAIYSQGIVNLWVLDIIHFILSSKKSTLTAKGKLGQNSVLYAM